MSAAFALELSPGPVGRRSTATVDLRPYQTQAIERIGEELAGGRSTLLVMATGTGKTTVFGALAGSWRGRVLVLAHRRELITQAADRLAAMTGEYVEIEQANERASTRARIVVASKDSLHPTRLQRFSRDHFGLVIVDEAHHAVAETYTRITNYFEAAKILGVTATPDRLDEKALGQVFDSVAFVYEILEAINDKWLCPIVGQSCHVESFDISALRTKAGDVSDSDLGGVVMRDEVMRAVVEETLARVEERPTIMFFPTVESAHIAAGVFNARDPGRWAAVDGSTDIDTRESILRRYKAGQLRGLCNVGVLTEGFDAPATAAIGIARPTKSRALWTQMVGRGTRILDGKPNCLVLDYVGNAGRHSLVGPVDALAGNLDDETTARAKKKAAGGQAAHEAIAEAKAEIAAERARAAARVAGAKKATSKWGAFDPFAAFGLKDPANDPWAGGYQAPASDAQRGLLTKKGIEFPEDITKAQANKLISAALARQNAGLASFKQVRALSRVGLPAQNMYFATANALISWMKADAAERKSWQWRRPPQEVVEAAIAKGRRR